MLSSLREKPIYKLMIWMVFAGCLILFIGQFMQAATAPRWINYDDFVEYWAAGRLNITGGDPYDPAQLLPLEQSAGRYEGVPVIMWNPPWTLALIMPFSLLGYVFSRAAWFILNFIVVLWCASLSWSLYGGSLKTRWIGWLAAFSFAPVLLALKTGQSGALFYLAVVGFLYFSRKEKDWLAGVFLSLLAIKPHVLYLFGLAALIWSIDRRRWRIPLAGGAAVILATAIAWAVNPQVVGQYLFALTNYPPEDWATSTLGGFSRWVLGTEKVWLQFLPAFCGAAWFTFHWWRQRKAWDWLAQAPLLILVSFATMAYGWPSDQIASLVAIFQIVILILLSPKGLFAYLIIGIYVLIDAYLLAFEGNVFWLWWLAAALLIFYLAARWLVQHRTVAGL